MSYFSSKSTWLSLVDTADTGNSQAKQKSDSESQVLAESGLDGITLSCEDFTPCFPTSEENSVESESTTAMSTEDFDYLRITRDLRHRLFFHFKEWEFGPALLEDHIRLAQAETNPEEALVHYCHARHVAVTLVNRTSLPIYILAMLDADRIIAEIHNLIGNHESCELYAKEGLHTIKKNKFDASLDMRITKLTIRFFNLLGRP
jgi:hypothetical protein